MNGKCVRKLLAFLLVGLLVLAATACAQPEEAAPGEQDTILTETQNRSVAVEGYEKLCWLDDNTLYLAKKEQEENSTTLVISRYSPEDDRLEEVLREEWADFGLEKFVCADTGTERVIFTGDALLLLAKDDRPGPKTGLEEQYGHMTDYNATRQQLAYVEPDTGDLYVCAQESGTDRLCYSSTTETEGRRYLYYPKQSPNGDKIACTVSVGDLAIYDSVVCVTAEGEMLFTISPIEKPEGSSLASPELAWWNSNLVLIQTNEIENEWYGTVQVFDGNNGQLLDSFRFDAASPEFAQGSSATGRLPYITLDLEQNGRCCAGVLDLNERTAAACYAAPQKPEKERDGLFDYEIIRDVAISPDGQRLAVIMDRELVILPLEQPTQPTAESEATAEPVLLLGRNLATCGLGLEFDDPQLCNPNRPELASTQVFGATHLSPSEVNGSFSSFIDFCERPVAVGGATIANVLSYSSFDTPEFKQLVETGGWTFAEPDSVFFEHNGHFYMEARDWQEGFLCVILQGFSVEELARPNAEIRVGNQRFTPQQLEGNVVYENDSWRVYAFTTVLCNDGDYDFVEQIREWAEQRENAEPYSGEWSYTDTEYDYSWMAPAVEHLQQNIGSYIFERNPDVESRQTDSGAETDRLWNLKEYLKGSLEAEDYAYLRINYETCVLEIGVLNQQAVVEVIDNYTGPICNRIEFILATCSVKEVQGLLQRISEIAFPEGTRAAGSNALPPETEGAAITIFAAEQADAEWIQQEILRIADEENFPQDKLSFVRWAHMEGLNGENPDT